MNPERRNPNKPGQKAGTQESKTQQRGEHREGAGREHPQSGKGQPSGRGAESEKKVCPKCGTPESEWSQEAPEGYNKGGQTYCCAGCAQDTGCTCESEESDYAEETRSQGREPSI